MKGIVFAAAVFLAIGFIAGWDLKSKQGPEVYLTISDNGDGGLWVQIKPEFKEKYLWRRENRPDKNSLPDYSDVLFERGPGTGPIGLPTGPIPTPPQVLVPPSAPDLSRVPNAD
ncbi:MAG: hypothetical protein ACJ8C4_16520 [Gemmataceae bacterium]